MRREGEGLDFRRIGAALFLICVGFLSFDFHPLPIGPHGIDAGWQWIVNHAAEKGWAWGSELVFTYGPLGWLLNPQDVGAHLFLAAAFSLALQILILWVLLRGLLEKYPRFSASAVLSFSVLWLLGANFGRRPEGTIVLVVILLCLDAVEGESVFSAALIGLLTALCVLIKASLGVSCLALLLLMILLSFRGKLRYSAAAGGGAFLLGLSFLLSAEFDSIGALVSWLHHSLEIISGYSTAASILGPRGVLLLCFGFLLLFLLALALLSRNRQDFRFLALFLLVPLLISFRLAFVRQDGHQFLYVPLLLSCLALPALKGGRRMALGSVGAALAGVVLASLIGALSRPVVSLPRVILANAPGPGSWAELLHPGKLRAELKRSSEENLRALRIDPEWVEKIRRSGQKVSVIPWEMLYAPANHLELKPLRSMQLYSSYTAELDRWTAEAFEGEGAPGWILDDFAPVGKRRALLDAPATWRKILVNYGLEDFDREWGMLLLKKRPVKPKLRWREMGTSSLRPGSTGVPVPESSSLVFAEIRAPLNLIGRLNAKFFRVPMLLAVFHRDDGTRSWARLIASTAENGILVNQFPRDLEAYASLWNSGRDLSVARLEILGPGVAYYVSSFDLRWRGLEILPEKFQPRP